MKSTPSKHRNLRLNPSKVSYQTLEPRTMLSANLPSAELAEALVATDRSEVDFLRQPDGGVEVLAQQATAGEVVSLVQQTYGGLPVFGSYLTVSESTELDVRGVGLDLASTEASADAVLGNKQAAERLAMSQLSELGHPVAHLQATPAWVVESGQRELVWQIGAWESLESSASVPNHWVLVDAAANEIVHSEASATEQQLFLNPATRIGQFSRIVINDTIGPAGSQAYADPFDSVVALPGCTGTLVAANVVVSARHCGSSVGDEIRFGEDSSSPIFTATVTNVDLPVGPGSLLDGGDINILTLDQDIPDTIATPMRLTDFTVELEGLVAATIGYGLNGVGSTGHEGSADGLRWGGENVIEAYGEAAAAGPGTANIISTDFDDGTDAANTIAGSDVTPLEFEATTAPGDSGGPILVQFGSEWVVAGVLSGGSTSTSVYGDISWWTGVAPYRANLEAAGAVFYTDGTITLDHDSYAIGATAVITVEDAFSSGSVEVAVTSTAGDVETLTLAEGNPGVFTTTIQISADTVSAQDGVLQVEPDGSFTVNYGFDSSDSATIESLQGTNGDDVIVVTLNNGININLNGEDLDPSALAAGSFDARGGFDTITIYDNPGDDTVRIEDGEVSLSGEYSFFAFNVESVSVISGGGTDVARIFGTSQDETFSSIAGLALLQGQNFDYGATNYSQVYAFGRGGDDSARLTDTAGNDQFNANSVFANLRSGSNLVNVRDFDSVIAESTLGGFDTANIVGTSGDEALIATPDLTRVQLGAVQTEARGFERVVARGNGGNDRASLLGSEANETFNTRRFQSYMFGQGYFNQVVDFGIVNAVGNGGYDTAIMFDTPGDDTLYATPDFASLYNDLFRTRATGFDYVNVTGSAGFDKATLVDGPGTERYVSRATDAFLLGEDYLNRVVRFNQVTATSSGGSDRAIMYGSFEDNRFFGSREQSYVQGSTFLNIARNFSNVSAQLTGAGFYIATLEDSAGNDTVIGRDAKASLFGDDYLIEVSGVDRVIAKSQHGGIDRIFADLATFELFFEGDWLF